MRKFPLNLKIRNGVAKWPLRQILHKYVPPQLVDRPKMGFGVPLGDWMKGPLRDFCENFFSESLIQKQGFLDAKFVRHQWELHLGGKVDNSRQLWAVLMWQMWLHQNPDVEF